MSLESVGRWLVRERSAGWCEVRLDGVCLGRATNWHHRRNRSAGGTWASSNGVALCGSGTTGCHGWITEHPADSARWGWTVKSWDTPAEVPVLLHTQHYQRSMVLLDDDGCYALAAFPEGDPRHPDDIPLPVVVALRRLRGVA